MSFFFKPTLGIQVAILNNITDIIIPYHIAFIFPSHCFSITHINFMSLMLLKLEAWWVELGKNQDTRALSSPSVTASHKS